MVDCTLHPCLIGQLRKQPVNAGAKPVDKVNGGFAPCSARHLRLYAAPDPMKSKAADMAGSANLNVMMKTARKAGRALLKDFGEVEQLQVSTKGPGDFVSRADRAAETIIREDLMAARPSYGFLGEENREIEGEDPTRRWIVDPLDGTTNFLHGLPHWAVSIALEHKGQIVAGVIYDPVKDEMFYAEKGGGAWLNESRLRVSGRHRMIESIFATGLPFAGRADLPETLQDLARLLPACAGVRRFGAAALDLAYVAAGRYDGFWERGLKAWDMAAGLVIVREAGGIVEPLKADADIIGSGEVICANEAIFSTFAKVIRKA
jgi:myo-inositol-1(or 4)-monophosphatase